MALVHAGRVHHDSPMPWESFQTVTDTDLRAIYRYLQPPAPTGPDPRERKVVLTAQND